jgi:phage/plasmid-associated DNA primase
MEKAAPQPTKQARPTQPAAGKAPRRTTLSELRRQRIEESPCVVEREEPNEEASRQRAYAEAVVDEFEVFEVDDEGRVHYHRDRHVDASLYGLHACSLGGTPMVWDGLRYLVGPAALKYMIGLTMRGATDREVTSMTKRVLNAIEFERRYELPSPDLIAFKNGILNVRTMELQEGRRVTYQDRIPNRIPHEIDLEAPADADVEKFLDLASDGHADVRRNLLQLSYHRYAHSIVLPSFSKLSTGMGLKK